MAQNQRRSPSKQAEKKFQIQNQFDFRPESLGTLYIDPNLVPDGMVYAYFTETVLGQPDMNTLGRAAKNGWRPVPADRHPELNPMVLLGLNNTMTDNVIRNGGQILLELPKDKFDYINEYFLAEARDKSRLAAEANSGLTDPNMPNVPWQLYAHESSTETRLEGMGRY
jgi:hypothetical protein